MLPGEEKKLSPSCWYRKHIPARSVSTCRVRNSQGVVGYESSLCWPLHSFLKEGFHLLIFTIITCFRPHLFFLYIFLALVLVPNFLIPSLFSISGSREQTAVILLFRQNFLHWTASLISDQPVDLADFGVSGTHTWSDQLWTNKYGCPSSLSARAVNMPVITIATSRPLSLVSF